MVSSTSLLSCIRTTSCTHPTTRRGMRPPRTVPSAGCRSAPIPWSAQPVGSEQEGGNHGEGELCSRWWRDLRVGDLRRVGVVLLPGRHVLGVHPRVLPGDLLAGVDG